MKLSTLYRTQAILYQAQANHFRELADRFKRLALEAESEEARRERLMRVQCLPALHPTEKPNEVSLKEGMKQEDIPLKIYANELREYLHPPPPSPIRRDPLAG